MRNKLFIQFILGFLVLLTLLGSMMAYVSYTTAEAYYEEANQRLNRSLAQYTVDHVAAFDSTGAINTAGVQDIMHSMMVINPDVEVYLLNPQGELLTHVAPHKKVVRSYVDLAPIKTFIAEDGARCVKGDDPRSESGKKIFSAAPIIQNEKISGYYYIILASQKREGILGQLQSNLALGVGARLLLFSLFFSFILGLGYIWYHTRKLDPILNAMSKFSGGDYTARIGPGTGTFNEISETYDLMAEKIEQQIEKVKSADNFKKELIANVSHDMRTPLTVIKGYAETLQLKGSSLSAQESKKYLENISESTRRASGLLNQLMELSKLENNQIVPNNEPFSIYDLVGDLISRTELLAEKKNIEVSIEAAPDLSMVFGDISLVERVIQNLVDNAIKYSPENSAVVISLEQLGDKIRFSIKDQGDGIADSELIEIFERYKRLKTNHNDGKSLGLGLAIAKRIVELHNSTITVHSRLKEGTTFQFSLAVI